MSKVITVIGTNPIINALIASGLFGGLCYLFHSIKIGFLSAIMAFAFLASLYLLLLSFPRSIVYKRAKNAILSGEIDPGFSIHHLHAGIIMVDEKSRKIFVNYSPVLDFDDISEVKWEDGKHHGIIKVVIKSGSHPVREVECDSGAAGENQFHRLSNARAKPSAGIARYPPHRRLRKR